ncbi:MAG: hypothetical protein JWR50_317 [Mucilaginibacter sp.]|nr:hypothetical protein [Mucilaginibacter sp.]
MMRKAYLTFVVVFTGSCLLLLSSCKSGCIKGSGHVVSEDRKMANFTKLDIAGAYKVYLKQDSSLNVTVSADDNLLKYIKTEVSGDKLSISTNNKNICGSGEISVTIGVKNINAIDAAGAIDISTSGKLVTKNVELDLSGATKLDLDLDAADVNTKCSGVTEISLKGQASAHNIELDGGGKLHAFDFVVGNYNIQTSGASECEINVLRDLTVNSSGATSIKYKGNPTSIHNQKSGVSSITKVD